MGRLRHREAKSFAKGHTAGERQSSHHQKKGHVGLMHPLIGVTRTLISVRIFPQTHNPSLMVKTKSDKPTLRDIPQNTQPGLLQAVKVIKQQESLRRWERETRGDQGDRMTKCNVRSWMGSCNKKKHERKNWWNPNRIWSLVNHNGPMLKKMWTVEEIGQRIRENSLYCLKLFFKERILF